MKLKTLFSMAIAAVAAVACSDSTDLIGSSTTGDTEQPIIYTDLIGVTSSTAKAKNVYTRTSENLLGTNIDQSSGNKVTAQFFTQFHMLDTLAMPKKSQILLTEDKSKLKIDSCMVILYSDTIYGDKDAWRTISMYEMNSYVPDGVYYADSENPVVTARKSTPLAIQKFFEKTDKNFKDSAYVADKRYLADTIMLAPDDLDPRISEYGREMIEKYYQNPQNFLNSVRFAKNVLGGFSFEQNVTDEKKERMSRIYAVHFKTVFKYEHTNEKTEKKDTITAAMQFASTPEVLSHTYIKQDDNVIEEYTGRTDSTFIKTPACMFAELDIPLEKIVKGNNLSHSTDVLSSAVFTLEVDTTLNKQFSKPKNLLLLKKSEVETFFKDKKAYNDTIHVVATYDSTIPGYKYSNLAVFMQKAYDEYEKAYEEYEKAYEKYKKEPSGNEPKEPEMPKFVLVPVSVSTDSSGNIIKVTHDTSFTNIQFAAGNKEDEDYSKLRIRTFYTKHE